MTHRARAQLSVADTQAAIRHWPGSEGRPAAPVGRFING